MKENYPLIIVFYLDIEMMKVKEIIEPFANSVNHILAEKNSNAIAFFLPTSGEERVECINPSIVATADMEKINNMIEDIRKNFIIGQEVDTDVPEIEITPFDYVEKECECGKSPDGECKCSE